jgi:hypothetical protein
MSGALKSYLHMDALLPCPAVRSVAQSCGRIVKRCGAKSRRSCRQKLAAKFLEFFQEDSKSPNS